MSNKKVKIISAVLGGMMVCAVGMTSIADVQVAKANNVKTDFSTEITATKLAHGQQVNILPYELMLWNQSEEFDASFLNGLYEYSDLHGAFLTAVNKKDGNAEIVDIYHQADAFQPENNVLKWNSSLEGVASYTVRVALDQKFTKCVLKVENADVETGVVLENPLVGTNYYWQVIATMENNDKVYSPIFDFSTDDSLRTVEIEGISNTRDLGGYETAYGYVQQGLVYRSARLESVTEDGLKTLKEELGVKTDLDLRGMTEATTGSNTPNPAQLENYYVYVTPQYALAGGGLDSADHWENVENIMKVFANKDNYPIDVHCAVGRDRTGTITALLKAVLGYAENDIINDYFVSMFATTGAWSKETTNTNSAMIVNVLTYLNSFAGETLADRAANYLIEKCNMTQTEIDAIRDIMTGKVAVENPVYNTFADVDNYADCAFVTFEKYGTTKTVQVVELNGTVEAPFAAGEGYEWIVNGEVFDFATKISGDITIQAVPTKACAVKILSTGAITSEETVLVQEGETFDFALLEKEGYNFVVISDDGQLITELTVANQTTINVIYSER